MADLPEPMLRLVDAVKRALADTGEAVVEPVEREADTTPGARPEADESYRTRNPRRQQVIDLLWPVEKADPRRARDLADAWMERMAICEMNDGLPPEAAEGVAFRELREAASHDGA